MPLVFRPLPYDIQNVIKNKDFAKTDGIILVSFGSWLQPEHMPPKAIRCTF
jgi:hypothetical protein